MATPHHMPFTPMQKQWIRLVVAGATREEILDKVFHIDKATAPKNVLVAADNRMSRWRKHPHYESEWNKAYREIWGTITYKAMRKLNEGLDDEQQPWRQTQHVNIALSYGTKIMQGEQDNVVKVQVEGMPAIGSPEQDET